MKGEKGWTLIELIVVMSILAILAAIALPRFINLRVEAKKAAIEGVAGAMRSAVALARAKYRASNSTGDTVNMDNTIVNLVAGAQTGIPNRSATGIGLAVQDLTVNYSRTDDAMPDIAVVRLLQDPLNGNCQVIYDQSNGNVSTDTTFC